MAGSQKPRHTKPTAWVYSKAEASTHSPYKEKLTGISDFERAFAKICMTHRMNISEEEKADSRVTAWWKKKWLVKLGTEEGVAEINHVTSEEHRNILEDSRTEFKCGGELFPL